MEDFIEAARERLKAPYFGYSFIAFVFLNWRAFYLLIKTKGLPLERLAAFDSATNSLNLMLWPFLIGAIAMASRPWLDFIAEFLRVKPESMAIEMRFNAESHRMARRQEMEAARRDNLAEIEKSLIGRAKRDQEIGEIEDEDLKINLKKVISRMRSSENDDFLLENKRVFDVFKAIATSKEGGVSFDPSGKNEIIVFGNGVIVTADNRYLYMKTVEALRYFLDVGWLIPKGEIPGYFELSQEGWIKAEQLGLVG